MSTPKFIRDVLDAYKKTGLKPRQCTYYHRGNACPLGVLAKLENPKIRACHIYDWAEKKFGKDFCSDVTDGFDYYIPGSKIIGSRGQIYGRFLAKKLIGPNGM